VTECDAQGVESVHTEPADNGPSMTGSWPTQRVEWIDDDGRLAALAGAWERLSRERDRTPFSRYRWFAAWWNAYRAGRELSVCVAWRDDALVGVLPLSRRAGRLEGPDANTPLFRPLAVDERALRALVDAALQAAEDELSVSSLAQEDPAVGMLLTAAPRRLTLPEAVHVSPIVDTRGDVDEFRRLTKPRWGYPLERLRRKMSREHDARFMLIERPDDFAQTLQLGFEVERSGWKGRAGTGILSTPQDESFWRGVAEGFDADGETRLSAITLDGAMIAFDLSLLSDNRLYLLKTGYDEQVAKLRPGLVLRLSVIERCFSLPVDAHELLGHTSAWKAMFATDERRHVRVRSYARRPLPASRYLYRRMRPRLLDAYRIMRRRRRAGVLGARPRTRPTGASPRGSYD
jgi:CelD/BcsL family acetyltransferase involved in cellulose biosynthesis